MNTITRFITDYINSFRKAGYIGKIVLGGIAFMCLCIFPITVLKPSSGQIATSTPIEVSSIQTAVVETAFAGNNQTLIANVPITKSTSTISPFAFPSSTNTEVLSSPTSTLVFTPTDNQTVLGSACIPDNPPQTGKVVDAPEGDTIKVLLDEDGKTYTVRYIGIDAPAYLIAHEFFGSEAVVKNVQLVFGKNITLIKDISEKDNLGRLLRYVLVDDTFVNYELVVQGFAHSVASPPDIACMSTFEEAEQKAATSKLGLWNLPPTSSGSGGGGSGGNCDPSYPTVCIPPFPPDLNCPDILPFKNFQVLPPDPHNFDSNHDGIGCES